MRLATGSTYRLTEEQEGWIFEGTGESDPIMSIMGRQERIGNGALCFCRTTHPKKKIEQHDFNSIARPTLLKYIFYFSKTVF